MVPPHALAVHVLATIADLSHDPDEAYKQGFKVGWEQALKEVRQQMGTQALHLRFQDGSQRTLAWRPQGREEIRSLLPAALAPFVAIIASIAIFVISYGRRVA